MSDADGADWPPLPKTRQPKPLPVVKVGDRVRVTVEGKVLSVSRPGTGRSLNRGTLLIERADGRKGHYFYGPGIHTELEVLEPAREHDAVYIDNDGEILRWDAHAHDGKGGWAEFDRYGKGGWSDSRHHADYPSLPLQKLR